MKQIPDEINESALELSHSMNVMRTDKFNDGYFELHKMLVEKGNVIPSRNGSTLELLSFKTIIENPLARCVGGKERNINIFFLLAEAIWIWAGKRDVAFLVPFNKQIAEYSDDGVNFHAPYGWRLRKYGVETDRKFTDSNRHSFEGIDQIAVAVKRLSKDSDDRRTVMSIWNAEFDLDKETKDTPCNDMVMLKIRNQKLNMTVQNRSNDLDWGLCTNVFQFSFILENMSKILDVEVGTQIHNSDSLHLYDWNALTKNIESNTSEVRLYDNANTPTIDYDFNFALGEESGVKITPLQRLVAVDNFIEFMIKNLYKKIKGEPVDETFKDKLFAFSEFLYLVYNILDIYIEYKNGLRTRYQTMQNLYQLHIMRVAYKSDYLILALNFFVIRFEKSKIATEDDEKIKVLIEEIRTKVDANIGKY